MVFVGMGLGMAMPILTLAIQNEFTHKDMGAATSSVQLFRGLGQTIGTAILSGVLTAGILQAIGDPNNLLYIQTLKQSPASAKLFDSEINADTLLQINNERDTIREQATKALNATPLPAEVREAQLDALQEKQQEYHEKVIAAFADSLRHIFIIAAILMSVATLIATQLPNRVLKEHGGDTPGIE